MANVAHDRFAAASWQGNNDVFDAGPGMGVRAITIQLSIGTDNLGAGDLWKFIKLSKNTEVRAASLTVTDLDTNGSPAITLDLGYDLDAGTDDDDYWLANSTIGQAGGTAASTANTFRPTDDYMVQVKVEAAAATAAAGTATLELEIAPKAVYS
jgi:hypothetical protein